MVLTNLVIDRTRQQQLDDALPLDEKGRWQQQYREKAVCVYHAFSPSASASANGSSSETSQRTVKLAPLSTQHSFAVHFAPREWTSGWCKRSPLPPPPSPASRPAAAAAAAASYSGGDMARGGCSACRWQLTVDTYLSRPDWAHTQRSK